MWLSWRSWFSWFTLEISKLWSQFGTNTYSIHSIACPTWPWTPLESLCTQCWPFVANAQRCCHPPQTWMMPLMVLFILAGSEGSTPFWSSLRTSKLSTSESWWDLRVRPHLRWHLRCSSDLVDPDQAHLLRMKSTAEWWWFAIPLEKSWGQELKRFKLSRYRNHRNPCYEIMLVSGLLSRQESSKWQLAGHSSSFETSSVWTSFRLFVLLPFGTDFFASGITAQQTPLIFFSPWRALLLSSQPHNVSSHKCDFSAGLFHSHNDWARNMLKSGWNLDVTAPFLGNVFLLILSKTPEISRSYSSPKSGHFSFGGSFQAVIFIGLSHRLLQRFALHPQPQWVVC